MKTQFKAESKKLLDLMINSIYTHKEIFLRELLSNASDAIDKLHFKSLTNSSIESDFSIEIKIDKKNRILSISDTGIGMTREELEANLGTIAKSGSLDFKTTNKNDALDIIGQFGVGFYSAFMVADKVTVDTKSYESGEASRWISEGADGYNIEKSDKQNLGTTVTLHIKKDSDDENYSEFLDEFTIKRLVKKHSDYLRYPIKMECEHSRKKEDAKDNDENAWETYKTLDTLNSMTPIWKKNKKDLSDEEINQFYKDKFADFENPAKVIQSRTEGTATYSSMLFIPSIPPFNYYTKDFEKGLQLYSSGVLIMEKCPELLPDYFSFVKGLVDSEDLSLNISRETLQHDRQLKIIAKSLEKKIKNELSNWLKNDRENYEKFFKNFGLQLKYGVYASYGANKDKLKDLLLFKSSNENKLTTISEYVSRMKEKQQEIYYACGDNVEKISRMPQIEFIRDAGYEILYLTDDIDEFTIKMLDEYDKKKFKNVASGDINLDTEEKVKENEEKLKQHSNLFEIMKEALKDKVSDVKLSNRLKNGAVCLTTSGEMSIEMEKVLNSMPTDHKVKAQRVLEINGNHAIFQKLCDLEKTDQDKLKEYAELLYIQAALIEGISPEDPVDFGNKISQIMAK